MRRWVVGAGAFVVAVLLALGAAYALGAGPFARKGAAGAPTPPCPEGWAVGPRGDTCQPVGEACHAFLNGRDDTTVTCAARSPDGQGAVKGTLAGEGTARVVVRDAEGRVLHDRTYAFAEAAVPLADLRGASGGWTLSVTFRARGSANIAMWG